MSMRLSPSFLGVTPDAICEKWATAQIIAQTKLICCREKIDMLKDLPVLQHTLLLRALVQGSVDLQLQRLFAFTALMKGKFRSFLSQWWATDCSGHTPVHQAYFNHNALGKDGVLLQVWDRTLPGGSFAWSPWPQDACIMFRHALFL